MKLSPQLNMSQHELTELCKSLYEVVSDQNFIGQVLAINDDIGVMSMENWQLKQPKDAAAAAQASKQLGQEQGRLTKQAAET